MSLRDFMAKLEKEGKLVKIGKPVKKKLEAAGILKALDGKPVLLENVDGSKVAGNIFSTKELIAKSLGCSTGELVKRMGGAIEKQKTPETVSNAPCQEVVENSVDLESLPILTHCEKDGGPYVSSGVVFAQDKQYGVNASFHRCMLFEKNKFAIRILQRHLDEFIKRNCGELDVAMAIGLDANMMLAGGTSVDIGISELGIANALKPLKFTKAKTVDTLVPADAEIILEGRILSETHSEGPFVDLTETYDLVRTQQVFEVKKITHRKGAIYHALLPGALEHKLLMGMPREPTIFKEVNKVAKCVDVSITPGGCSWLHAVVAIKKEKEEDGKNAIEAAFKGHASLKLATIVDEDINILDPLDVEWALATRFQGDTRLVLKTKEKGSSLDPSADPKTRETCKMGLDATKPLVVKGKNFGKAAFPKVDLKKFLE